MKTEPRH